MNTIQHKKRLLAELVDKEYRDAYVSSGVDVGIAFQIRALRKQTSRNWSQAELAQQADMKQERISALENPSNVPNIKTLKRLASAFDVGLIIRFVPFSELVNWETNLSPTSLKVLSFDQEAFPQDIEPDQIDSTFAVDDNINRENPMAGSADAVMLQEGMDVSPVYIEVALSDATSKVHAIPPYILI
jgi:transcriptional regulator with XRE-family HTH domain